MTKHYLVNYLLPYYLPSFALYLVGAIAAFTQRKKARGWAKFAASAFVYNVLAVAGAFVLIITTFPIHSNFQSYAITIALFLGNVLLVAAVFTGRGKQGSEN